MNDRWGISIETTYWPPIEYTEEELLDIKLKKLMDMIREQNEVPF